MGPVQVMNKWTQLRPVLVGYYVQMLREVFGL